MNRLAKTNLESSDMLFQTLNSTTRQFFINKFYK